VSDHGEEDGLDELERQLDAAFATTRPRRGFEDELWTRIESRRRRWPPRLAWPREIPWGMAGSLAVLLVIGLVAVTLARSDVGRGGGPALSRPVDTRSGPVTTPAPAAGRTAAQAPAVPGALAFGRVPAPAAAGVPQVAQGAALSPLPDGGARLVAAVASPPQPGSTLAVYRYDPASGPAGGTVLQPTAVPAGATSAAYPSRQPDDAISEAAARAAGSSTATQQVEVTLTQARLVYVAVAAGGQGYLEPAYLFTGTAQVGGATVRAQVLVPALAASALQ
jgi:hypothetical protein